jgi:hypothetical protein
MLFEIVPADWVAELPDVDVEPYVPRAEQAVRVGSRRAARG